MYLQDDHCRCDKFAIGSIRVKPTEQRRTPEHFYVIRADAKIAKYITEIRDILSKCVNTPTIRADSYDIGTRCLYYDIEGRSNEEGRAQWIRVRIIKSLSTTVWNDCDAM